MCQATAMKLEHQKAAQEEELQGAKERLESGLAPDEDAEREWDRMLRRREIRDEMIMRRTDELRQVQGDLQTTAVPRPNAYMPEVRIYTHIYPHTYIYTHTRTRAHTHMHTHART